MACSLLILASDSQKEEKYYFLHNKPSMSLYLIHAGIILMCLVLETNHVLTLLKGTLGIVFSLLSVYRQYVKYKRL